MFLLAFKITYAIVVSQLFLSFWDMLPQMSFLGSKVFERRNCLRDALVAKIRVLYSLGLATRLVLRREQIREDNTI